MATFNLYNLKEAIKRLRGVVPKALLKEQSQAQKGILYRGGKLLAADTTEHISLELASDPTLFNEVFIIPENAYGMILSLTGDEVEIREEEGHMLSVRAGKVKGKFKTHSVEEFVDIDMESTDAKISLNPADFFNCLSSVLPTINDSSEVKINILRGCCIKSKGPALWFYGTDSHMMAISAMKFQAPEGLKDLKIVIPKRSLNEFLKLRGCEQLDMMVGKNAVKFITDVGTLYCQMLNGEYPEFDQFLSPQGNVMEADSIILLESLSRINLLKEREKRPLVLKFGKESLDMSYKSEITDYAETLDFKADVEMEMGLNPRLMETTLKCLPAGKVKLVYKSPSQPITFAAGNTMAGLLPVNIAK